MIKDVFETIGTAARKMLTNWGALLISFLLYGALLAALYFFFTTREATTLQVLMSVLVLPLAAIVFFFVLQAIGLSYVRIGVGPVYLLKRALTDCWKLLLVSIPSMLLVWLILYLSDKVEDYLFGQVYSSAPSGNWKYTMLVWVRVFLLYFVLPLMTIHLWISTLREGIGAAIKGIGRNMIGAFAPRSVLTYMLIVVVFGVIGYFLFFKKVAAQSEWMELWLFGARLAIALIAVFLGWLLTLGSLAELTARRALNDVKH